MHTHLQHTHRENQSKAAAHPRGEKTGNASAFQFQDNRPEASAQRKLLQMMQGSSQRIGHAQALAMAANDIQRHKLPIQKKEDKTGLPDNLKTGIENLSGYSLDDVKVHYNSARPAQLQAHAYAQGTDIHIAPGQEKHLPHEAWHVVQQKQGRVKPTMQMNGNVNVNDDVGLEKEADVMGEKAAKMRPPQNTGIVSVISNGTAQGKVAQRILFYQGKQYKTRQEVAGDAAAFYAFQQCKAEDKIEKLKDINNVYDLENGLKKVEAKVEKSAEEIRNEDGASKTMEIVLPVNTKDYPEDATLYAPMDHAILVVNEGPIKFVGTNGLIGCVEVMLEYHTDKESAYLVAHVSSQIEDSEIEIRNQLGVMLGALSLELNKEISWAEFQHEGHARLTLVRNNPMSNEPRLFINMRNILAESGASMRIVKSASASLEITTEGARYYVNKAKDDRSLAPKMDFRKDKSQ